jgi:hypothetical protein
VLLVLVSIRVLLSEVTGDGFTDSWAASLGSDPLLAILKLAVVCVGIAVAAGLWSANRWAFWGYLSWMLLYFGAALVREIRVEPTIWKLAVGVALVSVLPLLGAAYLYKALAEANRRTSERTGSAEA